MNNSYEQGYEKKNEANNAGKNNGSTTESLVRLLVTTCYSRINLSDATKLGTLRKQFKEMLSMEERKYQGQQEKYNNLRNVIDLFFDYITDDRVVAQVRSGKLTKKSLETNFLADIMSVPKRKFDMKDLYRTDLIASVGKNSSTKNVRISFKNNGQEHIYTDNNGRSYKLTDIGSIVYEEWGGIKSDLTIYQLEKKLLNGETSKDLICTRIIISEMENPKYKKAVLEELLSEDNIHKSNAGIYVGQILKRKQSNNKDLPHTEHQTTNEYTYRIDDEYVLEYDATELSAVVEAIKQIVNQDREKNTNYRSNNMGQFDDLGTR